MPNTYDPGTNTKTYQLTLGDLEDGAVLVPIILRTSWVANHDPEAMIYAGPEPEDDALGVAGPQFTTFTVVAPQILDRLYVFNPATGNFGWINAAGVGPAPRPAG